MCGIAAYVGKKQCREFVMEGLSRLEYRGYDSAGLVCIDSKHGHFAFHKAKGRLSELEKKLNNCSNDGFIGMGHTRWATHGVANEDNAHPHFDCGKKIALVHNGIIENFENIRKKLIESGHDFCSDTDTETVVHYFESILPLHKNLKQAVVALVKHLKGAYTFVFLMEEHPEQLLVVRRRSPVAIGLGEDEMFVASDPLVFSDKTQKAVFLPDESFAIVKRDQMELYDFSGKSLPINVKDVDVRFMHVGKQGFDHYMLKEIYEQKQSIDRTIRFYKSLGGREHLETANVSEDMIWEQLGLDSSKIKSLRSINLVAAGTSWHSARIAQFFFESVCHIPTKVYLASEFRYMPLFAEEDSFFIGVSQSGETADTLEALRYVNDAKIHTVALTNVAASTMVRECDGFLLMQAGPEISVCSTKAFSAQLASLYWLAHRIALEKKLIDAKKMNECESDLLVAAEILESTIETYKQEIIEKLAKKYSKFDRFIFLGRHISYPFALEAALKLKEISYIFAQCYPSGELKHGPIALIDQNTPIVMFSSLDELIYQKTVSNAQEVKARMGHLLSFVFEGQHELISISDYSFVIPRVKPLLGPLAMTGLMQFLVYEITRTLGLPIDKPRNLAKSVTVE
jgi:glutamine---fructose-6-phosphate transaminase (isomerizing)